MLTLSLSFQCALSPVSLQVRGTQPYHLLSVSHHGQYICFNPTYHPQEQWPEVRSFTSTGELISWTQVYNPRRPASVYFDVCTVIAKNTVC
jgi:hypothetical protein